MYYLKDHTTGKPFIRKDSGLPFSTPDADAADFTANVLGPPWVTVEWLPVQPLDAPFDRTIIDELATNPGPYANASLQRDGGWWQRTLDQIDGVTIHHTLSDSPHATAKHYVNKGGGRPTIPYTVWITQTGEVLLCVVLTQGLWHDHTGHRNTHLSIGLAGRLHEYHPADVQLDAAAKLCVWTIQSNTLPGITDISQIKGHMDVGTYKDRTECPGWASAASGEWKLDLYDRIERLLS